VHHGLRRLESVLKEWGVAPPRVFAIAEPSSAVVAHAAAAILGVKAEPWPKEGIDRPGLIAVYDLGKLDDGWLGGLAEHRPGQVLFAHASCWTEDQPVSADIVTLLHQYDASPWEPQIVVRPDGKGTTKSDPAKGSPTDLAAKLLEIAPEPDELNEDAAVLTFARAMKLDAAAFVASGPRERQFAGSPVRSSRFS
jgi:hypothetical protein